MDNILSVTDLTLYLQALIEDDPTLADVWVQGEVSNWSRPRSGHCYFTLKDRGAELRCVMWRSSAEMLTLLPRDGDEIIAGGALNIYPERGQYQLYVSRVQRQGVGDLHRRFEALKEALRLEGLFDEALKRPLPAMPRRVGIVTSPTAAALQDILNVLRRRHPLLEVFLSPTAVQGADAPDGIVRALTRFEALNVDVVIVARGGGSIEDLWAFNDEAVARAIRRCRVPVISGVGHEVDFTIADFAADHRAPTPSAAAELVAPDLREMALRLAEQRASLHDLMRATIRQRRQQLTQELRALERLAPATRLRSQRQQVDALLARGERAQLSDLTLRRSRLGALAGRLASLDPRATLARGYAVVADDATGRLVRSPEGLRPGQPLRVTVEGGDIAVSVEREA